MFCYFFVYHVLCWFLYAVQGMVAVVVDQEALGLKGMELSQKWGAESDTCSSQQSN